MTPLPTMSIQRIAIREGQGFHQERATLLHELLHALENLTGYAIDDWDSDAGKARHALIGALETGLLAFLRENPDAVRWLTEP